MAAFLTFGFPWIITEQENTSLNEIKPMKGEAYAVNCDNIRTIAVSTGDAWEVFIAPVKGDEIRVREPKVNANNKAKLLRAKKALAERLHALGIDL